MLVIMENKMNVLEMLYSIKIEDEFSIMSDLANAIEDSIDDFADLAERNALFQHLLVTAICIVIFNRVSTAEQARDEFNAFAGDFAAMASESEALFRAFVEIQE